MKCDWILLVFLLQTWPQDKTVDRQLYTVLRNTGFSSVAHTELQFVELNLMYSVSAQSHIKACIIPTDLLDDFHTYYFFLQGIQWASRALIHGDRFRIWDWLERCKYSDNGNPQWSAHPECLYLCLQWNSYVSPPLVVTEGKTIAAPMTLQSF